jgi:hypothetical protein
LSGAPVIAGPERRGAGASEANGHGGSPSQPLSINLWPASNKTFHLVSQRAIYKEAIKFFVFFFCSIRLDELNFESSRSVKGGGMSAAEARAGK